jgi:flagellar biosynthesis GTPase FlhF
MALRIRRYLGRRNEVEDLVARAHSELGESVEIHRRLFRRGGLLGLLGGTLMVELIAMAEYRPEASSGNGGRRADPPGFEVLADEDVAADYPDPDDELSAEESPAEETPRLEPEVTDSTEAAPEVAAVMDDDSSGAVPAEYEEPQDVRVLRDELRDLGLEEEATQRERLEHARELAAQRERESQAQFAGVPRELEGRFIKLLQCGLAPDAARVMIQATVDAGLQEQPDDEWWMSVCREVFSEILLDGGISVSGSEPHPKVVMLVGPTGVGKTTTIAKIAAVLNLQKDLRVGLVSLDNYRIAAPEQLKTYADIMGISFHLAFTPDEYRRLVNRQRYQDVLLVDTAGRSPLNPRYIEELRDLLVKCPPDEVHLVLSATMGLLDIRAVVEKFAPLKYTHINITKLDESPHPGGIYNITRQSQKPVRYFTIGQRVPEDIREANLSFARAYCERGGAF